MTPELALADWLEELAVFGTPRRVYDSETAHHLSQAIKNWHLVELATESPERFTRRAQGHAGLVEANPWQAL